MDKAAVRSLESIHLLDSSIPLFAHYPLTDNQGIVTEQTELQHPSKKPDRSTVACTFPQAQYAHQVGFDQRIKSIKKAIWIDFSLFYPLRKMLSPQACCNVNSPSIFRSQPSD